MTYEAVESRFEKDAWRVEAIDSEHEGVGYIAIFSGPDPETRAREYAAWKNGATSRRRERETVQ